VIGRQSKLSQKHKYRLDLSPRERLADDLQRKVTEEMKEEIKNYIDTKYSFLEQQLEQNMNGKYAK
jgi:hypothetical protein